MRIYELENAKFNIDNENIVSDISFFIDEGESVVIYSSNNEYKELLKIFYLSKKLISGRLLYYTSDTSNYNFKDIEEYRINDSIYIDDNISFFDELSVDDNINAPIILNSLEKDINYFNDIIKLFGLIPILNKNILNLNFYDQLKVKIVRALIMKPFSLLLDNVTCKLEKDEIAELVNILSSINSIYGTTIIYGTNDSSILPYGSKKIMIEKEKTISTI